MPRALQHRAAAFVSLAIGDRFRFARDSREWYYKVWLGSYAGVSGARDIRKLSPGALVWIRK